VAARADTNTDRAEGSFSAVALSGRGAPAAALCGFGEERED
jgi:hypothetical protein